jgi:uridylate kinase
MTKPVKETTNKFAYKRVLLKISGEALMGEQKLRYRRQRRA